jgi:hypothetical protein
MDVYTDAYEVINVIVEFDSLVVFFWWPVEEERGARFQVDQCVMWSNLWESTAWCGECRVDGSHVGSLAMTVGARSAAVLRLG